MIRKAYRWLMPEIKGVFPLHRFNEKLPSSDYEGLIITSDIDATYLQTEVRTLRGLLHAALETAEEKHALQGMVPVLRGLKHDLKKEEERRFLYFISASPPQMREVLTEKMKLDQLDADGLTLKDPLRLMRRGRFDQIKHHILYKLMALLLNRCDRSSQAHIEEILLGDDSETDADIYLLYARILRNELSETELSEIFEQLNATPQEQEQLLLLSQRTDKSEVARIYIHRTFGRSLSELPEDNRDLLFVADDSFQLAIDAHFHGWLKKETLIEVALELDLYTLSHSLAKARQRHLFDEEKLQTLRLELEQAGLLLSEDPPLKEKPHRRRRLGKRESLKLMMEKTLPALKKVLKRS